MCVGYANRCGIDYHLFVSGIFAYLNYLVPAKRQEILDILIKGLQRLEYRGYDSAGQTFYPTCLWALVSIGRVGVIVDLT